VATSDDFFLHLTGGNIFPPEEQKRRKILENNTLCGRPDISLRVAMSLPRDRIFSSNGHRWLAVAALKINLEEVYLN